MGGRRECQKDTLLCTATIQALWWLSGTHPHPQLPSIIHSPCLQFPICCFWVVTMENKSRKSYCLSAFLLQNHRIAESSELEGTLKSHLVQLPYSNEHLQLDQVAQSPGHPDLGCLLGQGIHHVSGQPVPVFHHSYYKKLIPLYPI